LLARAEEHFVAAVERDPAFAEARVRLGRVMTLRGRPAEGAVELRRAIGLTSDEEVKYYGYLFLGNALELSADASGAMAAFQAAARLFPAAQSPQLAISRLASEQGDMGMAGAAIERVLAAAAESRFDPWWLYHRASGRHADTIYTAFARQMEQVSIGAADLWRTQR
jgi:tetratricopeptide (TPR) repeat protein